MSAGLRLVPPPIQLTDAPPPNWNHLARLSDDTGLLEHARNAIPRREHGYCVDDVGRGLLIASREPRPTAQVVGLAERYLAFLTHAQGPDGAFHNRMSFDRRWTDEPGTGDCWGRALWGLGTAAARSTVPWIRREAAVAFGSGARQRSPWPRAMAYAGLGAAEVLRSDPHDDVAAELLADAAAAVGVPGPSLAWVWPTDSLTYANPTMAEVVIAAGDLLGDEPLLRSGLRMLAWLCREQDNTGHLSVCPVGGWQAGVPKHRFDQQPIEAAAVADACSTALSTTGDDRWTEPLFRSIAWFLGDNDIQTVMYDPLTGGCYDGLTADGPNVNQGAESTLALVSTLQHARTLATRSATRPSGGLA
ncbi:glycosyl transferase [Paractinoplanes ferrugineus]|uniref:Glycosyl transferase n=1 Tax=Paractinoplanes ferrugineus TaxID=113564 RepID=A0A919J264_9ACTN|nr:glycosyltransferase [Actinoplanes ferrugineus]GIE13406.1 glycosyl transferase [Actinoplanes ferrugineus]